MLHKIPKPENNYNPTRGLPRTLIKAPSLWESKSNPEKQKSRKESRLSSIYPATTVVTFPRSATSLRFLPNQNRNFAPLFVTHPHRTSGSERFLFELFFSSVTGHVFVGVSAWTFSAPFGPAVCPTRGFTTEPERFIFFRSRCFIFFMLFTGKCHIYPSEQRRRRAAGNFIPGERVSL